MEGLESFCLARGLTQPPTELIYIFPGNKERTWSMFLTEYIMKDNRHSTTSGCKRKGIETCDTKLHPWAITPSPEDTDNNPYTPQSYSRQAPNAWRTSGRHNTPPFLTSNPPYTHKRQSPTCDTAPMPASVLRKHRQPSSFPRARWEQRLAPRRATCLSPPLLKLHILNHTDLSSPPNTSNSPPNYTLHSLTIVPSSLHEYTR